MSTVQFTDAADFTKWLNKVNTTEVDAEAAKKVVLAAQALPPVQRTEIAAQLKNAIQADRFQKPGAADAFRAFVGGLEGAGEVPASDMPAVNGFEMLVQSAKGDSKKAAETFAAEMQDHARKAKSLVGSNPDPVALDQSWALYMSRVKDSVGKLEKTSPELAKVFTAKKLKAETETLKQLLGMIHSNTKGRIAGKDEASIRSSQTFQVTAPSPKTQRRIEQLLAMNLPLEDLLLLFFGAMLSDADQKIRERLKELAKIKDSDKELEQKRQQLKALEAGGGKPEDIKKLQNDIKSLEKQGEARPAAAVEAELQALTDRITKLTALQTNLMKSIEDATMAIVRNLR